MHDRSPVPQFRLGVRTAGSQERMAVLTPAGIDITNRFLEDCGCSNLGKWCDKSVNESDSIAPSLPPRGWKRWRQVVSQNRLLALTFSLGLTATAFFKTNLPLKVIASCIGIGIIAGITRRGYTIRPMGAVFLLFFLSLVIEPAGRLLPGPWVWNALAFSGVIGITGQLTYLVAAIVMPTHRRNDT